MSRFSQVHNAISVLLTISLFAQFLLPIPLVGKLATAAPSENAPLAAPPTAVSLAGVETEPAVLAQPVTLTRVQSASHTADTLNNTLTISFTVSNNQIAANFPDITSGGTVTDSAAILSSLDLAADRNALHNVTLADTLEPGVTYVNSSFPPGESGSTLTWTLPDIPPGTEQIITLTLQVPGTAADFIDLDSGAEVSADLWDVTVNHATTPARLVPSSVGAATTRPTADADSTDQDMLWRSASLAGDPLAIFNTVRAFDYEAYDGSLRGTRGTLWSSAGNSADQASLLIAMLRANGIPARYRHGTLDTSEAQTLLAAMFSERQGVAGNIPSGTATADPINDPALISLVQDHWWVEAYLPGQGWTDLDPSFADAAVGQLYATPGSNDRIASLPATVQHSVTLTLLVEQYTAFPIGGTFLQQSTPLSATIPTAKVAGKQIVLGTFVRQQTAGGSPFTSRQIFYEPYFGIEENGEAYLGEAFQDLLTNFPLATVATTAVWLQYEITTPDGQTESYQRTIKDRLGPDVRLNGGQPDITFDLTGASFLTPEEQYVSWVLPNDVPEWAYARRVAGLLTTIQEIGEQTATILDVAANVGDEYTQSEVDALVGAVGLFTMANTDSLSLTGLRFATEADAAMHVIESSLHANMYYNSPRVFAVGTTMAVTNTFQANVDLRATSANVIVAPGQSPEAEKTARWLQGQVESELEGAVLETVYEQTAVTAANIFAAMPGQNIEPVLIHPDEAYLLDLYPYSPDGKANMLLSLTEGKSILAPSRHVLIDGEPALAWWEIDPDTGETISVGEDGLHTAAVNWVLVEMLVEQIIIGILEFILGVLLDKLSGGALGGAPSPTALIQLAELCLEIGQNLSETFFALADVISGNRQLGSPASLETLGFLPAHLCPVDNCGIEQFFLAGSPDSPLPLPDMLFSYNEVAATSAQAMATVIVNAALPPGDPAFTVTAVPDNSAVPPAATFNFQADIASNFDDSFVVTTYAPDEWNVTVAAGGQIAGQPPSTAAPGAYTILIVVQSTLHPELTATAEHIVTVTAVESMSLALVPEANITVPMGERYFADVSNQTNDGEAEIDDAAYVVELINSATTTHTYDVVVAGPPAGWVILDGARQAATAVTLAPGVTAHIGLYIQPEAGSVPAPGTSFAIDVTATATDNPALTDNDSDTFTMPDQPFNFVTVGGETLYVAAGGTAEFDVAVNNISNAGGTFPIAASLPISTWVVTVQSPVMLAVGETLTETAALEVPLEAPVGQRAPLIMGSSAPGSYTQYDVAQVQIVSTDSAKIFAAAASCSVPNAANLPATIEALGFAVVDLEASCQTDACSLVLRDRAVVAIDEVADQAELLSAGFTAVPALRTIATELAGHTETVDILADITALGDAVALLDGEICEVTEHSVDARFDPTVAAVLASQPVTYTLDVTNFGSVTTTYGMTITLPTGVQTFADTIAAGTTTAYEFPMNLATLDSYLLEADVVALAPDVQLPVTAHADATLRVVDRFIQLTDVSPTPPFVETGNSATTIDIEVANIANIARAATAETTVIAPGGGISFTADIPLTIAAGNPRRYELTTLDTSGWSEGSYTVDVNLVDGDSEPIPDGAGFGTFAVGEALVLFHSVAPGLVPPGDVTVTTQITTEIREGTILTTTPAANPSEWIRSGLRLAAPAVLPLAPEPGQDSESRPANTGVQAPRPRSLLTTIGTDIIRTEDDEVTVAYTGSWSNINLGRASGGNIERSNSAGDVASFAFNSDWVGVGFIGGISAGQAEIFVDGVSQEVIDLYRREDEAISRYYSLGISATHTISVSVLGTNHPNANNTRVNVDFFDIWTGNDLADGTFEQDNVDRVFLSNSWSTVVNGAASGGDYVRSSISTAWFPFTGDSVSYHAIAYTSGGWAKVYLDGQYQTTLNLYSPSVVTRSLSFDGWGAGPHVLQISSYRGLGTVDAFTTPGSAPFYMPPNPSGITRYEEDAPSILYNGETLTQTATSWSEITSSLASDGFYLRSTTAADTMAFAFGGSWVGLGFVGGINSGESEIFIDGVSQGIIDLYRHDTEVVSVYFDDLISATHTISLTVLGTHHPNSGNSRVNLDYIDTWDGTTLADGSFEAELGNEDRLLFSPGWFAANNAAASGGDYVRSSSSTAWFPFTGDSLDYRAIAYPSGGTAKLYVDGRFLTTFFLYNSTVVSRTLSFAGFGDGPHLLQVSSYRGTATLDTFTTPAAGTPYTPPTFTGVSRYEEDFPAILYNGETFSQTVNSWDMIANPDASRGYYHRSNVADDTISLTFDGRWVGLGFTVGTASGEAEVFLDGVSQGVVDLYDAGDNHRQIVYDGLITGTHTISLTVLGTANPNATNTRVNLDFIDIWDGNDAASGWYEPFESFALDARVDMSNDWTEIAEPRARSDSYYQLGDNAWFRFTGNDVTVLAFSHPNVAAEIEVFIDGVSQGTVDITYGFSDSPLPLHYTGLGAGAHVVRVRGLNRARLDAFEANPTTFHPGLPMVEWWDATAGGTDGVISTVAAGDVDGDDLVEIAVSSNNGNLYLYQGDGSDTGGGTPILWSYATGSEPDAPVMVELDGNPGVEIFVGSDDGVHALHSDGTVYWFTDTVKTGFPAGGAAAGNLDLDDAAEIVVAADSSVVVFEADGSIGHEFTSFNDQVLPPVLADFTGDGLLDIVVAQPSDDTITLLDYDQGIAPVIVWTHVLTSDILSLRGSPAVANLDGDPEPEVIVTSSGFVTVLNHDGSLLWNTPVGAGAPGGVSVADTDGDGEMEIITTVQFNGGTIYVLNADGSLLWEAPATDGTSGTSASAHDLDGDGSWEVIWNGAGMGLVIYNGADGEILFNEPDINSITRTDFPVVVDVDNDGHAEILAGDPAGFYVVGYDTVWTESRELWNQYNYHVTNINDDLTVPPSEPDSWDIHNTYRTQTPLNAFAAFGVSVSHTVGITGVTVLTNTFSEVPTDNYPLYSWAYTQYWYQPQRTLSFDSVLTDMQPGEVRQVAAETTVAYTLPSGQNTIVLPPLYVNAAHIVALEPVSQTVAVGGTAVYTLTLSNPAATADTYVLDSAGLDAAWPVMLPDAVLVPANGEVQVAVVITVPVATTPGTIAFAVTAAAAGGTEPASAFLTVVDGVDVSLEPPVRTAPSGTSVTYTLSVSNLENSAQTYDLAATGLADVTVPAQVVVAGSSTEAVLVAAVASSDGPHPFTVQATAVATGATDSASALLEITGERAVDVGLLPATAVGGRGSTISYTVVITNLGTIADSYDLEVTVPSGWSSALTYFGHPVSSVDLPAHVFNSRALTLLVTPAATTIPDDYPVTIMATSQADAAVTAATTGTATVLGLGLQVEIVSGPSGVDPGETAVWQVEITNVGLTADTYSLKASGIVALNAVFSPESVSLDAGQAQTVQLTSVIESPPQTYTFAVFAQSDSEPAVAAEDKAAVTINGVEAVEVAWLPAAQTVTDVLTATFQLAITNTGSVATRYDLMLDLGAAGGGVPAVTMILPAETSFVQPVAIVVPEAGVYSLTATAASPAGTMAGATATLTVVDSTTPPEEPAIYLPLILTGN